MKAIGRCGRGVVYALTQAAAAAGAVLGNGWPLPIIPKEFLVPAARVEIKSALLQFSRHTHFLKFISTVSNE